MNYELKRQDVNSFCVVPGSLAGGRLDPVALRALQTHAMHRASAQSLLQTKALPCAGESEMKELKRQDVKFALVVADSLLARDQLDRALKTGAGEAQRKAGLWPEEG